MGAKAYVGAGEGDHSFRIPVADAPDRQGADVVRCRAFLGGRTSKGSTDEAFTDNLVCGAGGGTPGPLREVGCGRYPSASGPCHRVGPL